MTTANLILAILVMASALFLAAGAVRAIRRLGFVGFCNAVGKLMWGIVAAFLGLFATMRPDAMADDDDGVGGSTVENDADRIGAGTVPEAFLGHPDPEISSIAASTHAMADND